MIVATFSSCFLLLLLLLLKNRTTPSSKSPWQWRTEKHQNCAQKLPNVTSETIEKDDFSYFFLLFPPAAAAAPLLLLFWNLEKKMIVATFSSCFLLLLLLLLQLRWQAAMPKIEPLPAANPHGSEGRKSIAQKLPNVTSETYRKRWF